METFDALTLDDKVGLIVREGIHMATVPFSLYQADLYAVRGIFVQVLLRPKTLDFVQIAQANGAIIDKFLDTIDLSLS